MSTDSWRAIQWPDGQALCFSISVAFEAFEYRSQYFHEHITPGTADRFSLSYADYGGRVGVWRLLALLDEYQIKASFSCSGLAGVKYPEAITALVQRGHELVAHGWANDLLMSDLEGEAEDREREVIHTTIDALTKAGGTRPVGWSSPGNMGSSLTNSLLVEAGIIWSGDDASDDVPFVEEVGSGRLVVLPKANLGANDLLHWIIPKGSPRPFLESFRDTFDALYQEGLKGRPGWVEIVVHCHMGGRATFMPALREAIEHVRRHESVWWAQGSDRAMGPGSGLPKMKTQDPSVVYEGLPTTSWANATGLRTLYVEGGWGVPVVLIHGGNFGSVDAASGAYVWRPAFNKLAETFRLIAYDRPGQGLTDNPARAEDYTMAFVVRHLIEFVEALGLPPVHLVGHSRGGYVATRATLLRPDLVRSLSIVSSGTLSPGVGTNEVVLSRPPHEPLSRESARWVYEQYCYSPSSVDADWIEASYFVMNTPKYAAGLEAIRQGNLLTSRFLPSLAEEKAETLRWIAEGRLQRPTQILWGHDDRTAKRERGMELFGLVSEHERNASLHVVTACGHFPYREQANWFVDTVAGFLRATD